MHPKSWRDEFISWNPADFCGIKKLLVNNDYFWKPDLYIFEMMENDENSPQIPYYILQSTGKVINAMPLRIVSTCNLDIFKFPFDNQTCRLTFGSYVYGVSDMVMWPKSNTTVVNKNAFDVFATKNDWTLQAVTVHNTTMMSEGVEYSLVIYSIEVKRASIIYVLNLIIPVCFLVFLDLSSMFIRSYSVRLDFKITVVLGFSVLLLILNDMLPNSDKTPMLGIFCCISMAMMVLSIMATIATSYMTEQSTTNPHVPAWIKILVLKHLAPFMFFRKVYAKDELVIPVKTGNDPENAKTSEKNEAVTDKKKALEKDINVKKEVKLLKRILLQILKIHHDVAIDMQQKDLQTEWTIVAQVVDRLVLILYFIIRDRTISIQFKISRYFLCGDNIVIKKEERVNIPNETSTNNKHRC
ncbi:PREDICTED: 5-hydroxytryptamine receptor 3C-like [Nanorana parkeri]|uniref:5-hydroxytryptamine receptor 3C-like n=1 Tax=Nanorana parkeri TaxID=125878 RepID=UPI0008541472|nr:PREDICTED: 5-hydroxytryptamine receptor 3C-like [Nanorana parkeri]